MIIIYHEIFALRSLDHCINGWKLRQLPICRWLLPIFIAVSLGWSGHINAWGLCRCNEHPTCGGRPTRRCISEVKSEQKALADAYDESWPIGPSDLPQYRTLDKTIVHEREKAAAAPCADALRHEYECPERRSEVREVGIRIPGHIRPPLASPSNSFGTRFRLSLEPPSYAWIFAQNAWTWTRINRHNSEHVDCLR